jgi:hypothetical protein
VEDDDPILVVGAADGACALFLAARGACVQVVDPDLAAVYGLENRAITESLGGRIDCEVVALARFAPDARPFAAAVIEAASVAELPAAERRDFVDRLKRATPPTGWHVIMPAHASSGAAHVSTDALRTLYADWDVELAHGNGARRRHAGFIARLRGDA